MKSTLVKMIACLLLSAFLLSSCAGTKMHAQMQHKKQGRMVGGIPNPAPIPQP